MNYFAQRLAIDEFHRDEVHAIVLANLVDVRNVRMIQSGRGRRLLFEATHSIPICADFRRQDF